MSALRFTLLAVVAALACTCNTASVLAQQPPADERPNKSIELANKALDMTLNFDFEQQPLSNLLDYIEQQTRVRVSVDPTLGITPNDFIISLRERNISVRSALRKALAPSRLSFAVDEDGILISDEMILLNRQLTRRVSVDLNEVPAGPEMRKLARANNFNFVLDPRVSKQAQSKVSLTLDDVPIETVIKLLADLADLQCVRLSNVLYVTTPERAQRFIHEQPMPPFQPGFPAFGGGGFPAFGGGGFPAFGGGGGNGVIGPMPIDPPIAPPNGRPGQPGVVPPEAPPPVLPALPPGNPDAPVQDRKR